MRNTACDTDIRKIPLLVEVSEWEVNIVRSWSPKNFPQKC